jgi:hypothetical protein
MANPTTIEKSESSPSTTVQAPSGVKHERALKGVTQLYMQYNGYVQQQKEEITRLKGEKAELSHYLEEYAKLLVTPELTIADQHNNSRAKAADLGILVSALNGKIRDLKGALDKAKIETHTKCEKKIDQLKAEQIDHVAYVHAPRTPGCSYDASYIACYIQTPIIAPKSLMPRTGLNLRLVPLPSLSHLSSRPGLLSVKSLRTGTISQSPSATLLNFFSSKHLLAKLGRRYPSQKSR